MGALGGAGITCSMDPRLDRTGAGSSHSVTHATHWAPDIGWSGTVPHAVLAQAGPGPMLHGCMECLWIG